MTTEVGNQPVVNVVWYIQICHLIQKGTVAHVVKSLTKVKRYDNYIRVCGQKPRDRVQKNKKLSYRRGTARCVVSIEILPIATQQCRNYLYDKS